MKQTAILAMAALVIGFVGFTGVFAGNDTPAMKAQVKCPVMGGDIDRNIYVDKDGQRIYFCCESCKAKFQADPDKYLAKMKADGVKPEKIGTRSGKHAGMSGKMMNGKGMNGKGMNAGMCAMHNGNMKDGQSMCAMHDGKNGQDMCAMHDQCMKMHEQCKQMHSGSGDSSK